jgi:hypothetical protein
MRLSTPQTVRKDLAGGQAAQLLREGRLGQILLARAESQVAGHRRATDDQAEALRRAVRAQQPTGRPAISDGATA